jgi:hypothetical protein
MVHPIYLGVFKTLSQDGTARHADVTWLIWKVWSCSFTEKKYSLPKSSSFCQIAFEMDEFFPAGRFT